MRRLAGFPKGLATCNTYVDMKTMYFNCHAHLALFYQTDDLISPICRRIDDCVTAVRYMKIKLSCSWLYIPMATHKCMWAFDVLQQPCSAASSYSHTCIPRSLVYMYITQCRTIDIYFTWNVRISANCIMRIYVRNEVSMQSILYLLQIMRFTCNVVKCVAAEENLF